MLTDDFQCRPTATHPDTTYHFLERAIPRYIHSLFRRICVECLQVDIVDYDAVGHLGGQSNQHSAAAVEAWAETCRCL